MRRGKLILAAGGVTAAVVAGMGLAAQPEGLRDGQIVFVRLTVEPVDSGPGVELQSCSKVASGLRVQGWVPPVESGQHLVAVTPGEPSTVGVMVGSGYATRSGLLAGSPVGSFEVTLPGLDAAQAAFTLAGVDSRGAGVSRSRPSPLPARSGRKSAYATGVYRFRTRLGPATRCPR